MFLKVVLEYILQNTTNDSSQLKGFRDLNFFAERKDDKPFKTQFVEQRCNKCKDMQSVSPFQMIDAITTSCDHMTVINLDNIPICTRKQHI